MDDKPSTAEKVLLASRQLFNSRGYAATSLSDIARSVGISKGNLTYHFPTKRDLAAELITRARTLAQPSSSCELFVRTVMSQASSTCSFATPLQASASCCSASVSGPHSLTLTDEPGMTSG